MAMTKNLGRAYYAFVGACVVGVAAIGAVSAADAGTEASPPFVFASGYGADAVLPARAETGRPRAVTECLNAASARFDGAVSLAQVNRAWEGSEGWIVDLSVDVARDGGRAKRRDLTCRQGEHGLHVAR